MNLRSGAIDQISDSQLKESSLRKGGQKPGFYENSCYSRQNAKKPGFFGFDAWSETGFLRE
ncbi:MAG: hypothetical protein ABI180_10695 [Microcoleus sp.]|jgi:hypothetical protein